MSEPATLPAGADADDSDLRAWAEGLLRRQAAMLEQLGAAALRLALAIERRVSEASPEDPVEPAEAAMAFSRAARAGRLTALLQSRLVQDLMRLQAGTDAGAGKAALAEAAGDAADHHKARVEAIVARVAKADCDDEDEIDRLVGECAERLDDEDIYGEVLDRPVGELVSLICRDLGLEPDWARLAEEAWAREEAAAGDPRSPFAVSRAAAVPRAGPGAGPPAEPGPGEAGPLRRPAPCLIVDSG